MLLIRAEDWRHAKEAPGYVPPALLVVEGIQIACFGEYQVPLPFRSAAGL